MVGSDRTLYVVDSSSWISIEGHPAANKILYHVSELIEHGAIEFPPEVWGELKKCDYVLQWLKPMRKDVVRNLRQKIEYLQIVGRVTFDFPGMAGARGTRNKADPYVVAQALYHKQMGNPEQDCIVVCDETTKSRPNRKIPSACLSYGITPIRLMEMLEREYPEEDWQDDPA